MTFRTVGRTLLSAGAGALVGAAALSLTLGSRLAVVESRVEDLRHEVRSLRIELQGRGPTSTTSPAPTWTGGAVGPWRPVREPERVKPPG